MTFRKIALPVFALLAVMLIFAPAPAAAGVRVGVFVGGPAYPVYHYRPYVRPYVGYAPYAAYGYAAPAPYYQPYAYAPYGYVAPSYGLSLGFGYRGRGYYGDRYYRGGGVYRNGYRR